MRILGKYIGLLLLAMPLSAMALSVSPSRLTAIVGQSASLNVTGVVGSATVASSNPNIVTAYVSANTVYAKAQKAGTASLTVSDSKAKYVVQVTVKPVLTISQASLTLRTGATSSLKLSNASGAVSISVSDPRIINASLSTGSINVSANAPGAATIAVRDAYSAMVVPVVVVDAQVKTGYTLVAWNDLGMHCMDSDYSVFSILPPFNNLHAQLVDNVTGKLVKDGGAVKLTYEAMADPYGSINSASSMKTNFWDYADALYGANPGPDTGLTGNSTATLLPQPLAFNPDRNQFEATGIPITPIDDAGQKNTYPMVKVVARDAAGNLMATARVVLPVSDEMSCKSCHASTTDPSKARQAAKPVAGWVSNSNPEIDHRLNILSLHDEKFATSLVYQNAMTAKGYFPGLVASVLNGKPILCAACHASNALPGTGIVGIKPLTEAMHAKHSKVLDPTTGLSMDSSSNRSSCYQCHPGSTTKCLRGVMGNSTLADGSAAMQCQSCHGTMSKVGATGRVGWLQQPNCQACHHDGKRELSAVSTTGAVKTWSDIRFATTPNTPATGFSLYRMSKGHGGLQCEACHGATHAEYESSHVNDNLLSVDLQGHSGTVAECSACHASTPMTTNAGPHGMHTTGQSWVSRHGDYAEGSQKTCAYCHGANYRGGVLSTIKMAKTFRTEDGRSKTYSAGQKVGCYDCHNGPSGD